MKGIKKISPERIELISILAIEFVKNKIEWVSKNSNKGQTNPASIGKETANFAENIPWSFPIQQ